MCAALCNFRGLLGASFPECSPACRLRHFNCTSRLVSYVCLPVARLACMKSMPPMLGQSAMLLCIHALQRCCQPHNIDGMWATRRGLHVHAVLDPPPSWCWHCHRGTGLTRGGKDNFCCMHACSSGSKEVLFASSCLGSQVAFFTVPRRRP
jgi:hypothetical protein